MGYHEEVSPTLKGAPSGLAQIPCICEPEIARTRTARGDSSPCADRGQNIVAYGICSAHSNSMQSKNPHSGIYEAETGKTLDASGISPACNQGGVAVVHPKTSGTLCASGAGLSRPAGRANETDLCVAYCLQGNMIGRKDENGPQGSGVNENVSFTLDGGGSETLIATSYIVRRLTPTECERLMGFPDDWTACGADGREISDSKRYQMLGNSICTPCAAYIFSGVADELRKDADAF
jgi:DNA (cytosine-5)-methyltransferase 1